MEVVLSTLLEETVLKFAVLEFAVLEFNVPRIPSTSCRLWDAAVASFTWVADAELFKSLRTVTNADWAVDRSPELNALPNAVISVESWELLDNVLPVEVAEFWKSDCNVWKADWALVRLPDARLFCKVRSACC
jgi:hypothetical protein